MTAGNDRTRMRFESLVEELKKGKKPTNDLKVSLARIFRRPKVQRTLTIIKPDAVEKGLVGEIIRRLEKEGIKPVGMKMLKMNQLQAQIFYSHLRRKLPKRVFDSIIDYMTGTRVVAIVWQGRGVVGKVRTLCGPTDPKKAKKSQLRSLSKDDLSRQFARGKAVKNIIHSSASPHDARKEIALFFLPWEILRA